MESVCLILAALPDVAGIALLALASLCVVLAYWQLRHSYLRVQRAQREWMATFDSIRDLIIAHDRQGHIVRVNRALSKRLGTHPIEMVGKRVSAALLGIPSDDPCPYCRNFSDGVSEGEDPCFGGRAMISTSSMPAMRDLEECRIHVIRDISEQVAAEERYRRLFHGLQEGVFITTPEGVILECNAALVSMLGYASRAELLTANTSDIYACQPGQRQAFDRAIAERGFVQNHEVSLRRKDGAELIALETSFATRDKNGHITSFQGFLLDVTESRRAQEEIRRRNRELHMLNTIAGITTRSLDLDEVLNLALRQVIELFATDAGSAYSYDRARNVFVCRATKNHAPATEDALREITMGEELIRELEATRPDTLQMDDAHVPEVIRTRLRQEGMAAGLGVLLWSREGLSGFFGVSCRATRVFTADEKALAAAIGRQIAVTVENVRLYEQACLALEDLQRTQEQLLQSEKMAAVGQLISGVAHELNNPLTAVLGYSQLLESEPLNERARDFVQKIFRQAQRTHRVVQNLLSFARQRKPKKEQVDLRRVLEETLVLRDYDLKLNNITLLRNFTAESPYVVADAHQLEQVFLNIINNAVDAILEAGPDGGSLRVSVHQREGHVVIEFHDSGPGLRDTKRIFDPFYTTKKLGKGTGLGLSICYGIVKEHGGEIQARNHDEGGAIFQVSFPPARMRSLAPTEKVLREPAALILTGRILLVDDEEPVLEFEREVLAGAGAEIVSVGRGEDAIELLQRQAFDVLVFDGRIPGRYSGVELCRWLESNRPDLLRRVILTVSDSSEAASTAYVRQHNLHCLTKPFAVADLLAACQAVLEARSAVHA